MLALESTAARMNRLGSSVLAELPLLTVDEIIERVDAVTADDVRELAASCSPPGASAPPAIGGDEAAVPRRRWSRSPRRWPQAA